MISDNPKITILLATFNRAHLIGETLDSILAQTYINWECLIVDDHSKDGTEGVITEYIEKDSRFEYYKKTDNYQPGLSGTRNYGLDLAAERNSEFIQFFDDDDIMHPQKLELQIEPLLNDTNFDLSICCYRKFHKLETIEFDLDKADDHSCNIKTKNLLKAFYLNQINLNSPGPLWKAQVLLGYRFNEDLYYAEERDFYLRIFLHENLEYYPVDEILFWYRKHDMAITSNLYVNSKVKQDSHLLFQENFKNEVLQKSYADTYFIKSFLTIAIQNNDKTSIKQIRNYIYENLNIFNLGYIIPLIKINIILK